jgi:hypothetical protein
MILARHDDLATVLSHDVDDLGTVRGNDHAFGHTDLDDTLPDANDQRQASEKT